MMCLLSAPYKLEVGYIRRGHGPHELEPMQIADAIEQPLTTAEERRHDADFHLVHETGREKLVCGIRTASERYVFAAGGSPCLFERRLDAAGDEREDRTAFKLERLACVMREHEHRVMERRVGSPPTGPRSLGIPGTRVAAEHIAPHHGGADVCKGLLDNRRARVDLSALKAMHRAPDREWERPLVKAHATDPERIFDTLIGTSHEAVERHRDPEAQLGQLPTPGNGHALDQASTYIVRPARNCAFPLIICA